MSDELERLRLASVAELGALSTGRQEGFDLLTRDARRLLDASSVEVAWSRCRPGSRSDLSDGSLDALDLVEEAVRRFDDDALLAHPAELARVVDAQDDVTALTLRRRA